MKFVDCQTAEQQKTYIRFKLLNDQTWLEQAILTINARQTTDEKQVGETKHLNGRGWNNADANRGTRWANYIRNCRRLPGKRLTGDFIIKAKEMMMKYCGQLVRCTNERLAA